MMSKNTKIIEYFGLPGCGKTTECRKKIYNLATDIAVASDISKEMGQTNICKLFVCIPWYIILPLLHLFIAFPFVGIRNLFFYKMLIKKEFIYNFIKNKSKYKIVYIDHGMAQSILSLIFCKPTSYSGIIRKNAIDVLKKSRSSKIVYCAVTPEISASRILNRKNHTMGRLDNIYDENTLLEKLRIQHCIFEDISSLIHKELTEKYMYLDLKN